MALCTIALTAVHGVHLRAYDNADDSSGTVAVCACIGQGTPVTQSYLLSARELATTALPMCVLLAPPTLLAFNSFSSDDRLAYLCTHDANEVVSNPMSKIKCDQA